MEDIAKNTSELAVRYIDVTDAREEALPVVQQYNVKGTPEFILFNPDGKQTMRGLEVWRMIQDRWGNGSK